MSVCVRGERMRALCRLSGEYKRQRYAFGKEKKKVTDLELKSLIKKSICLSEYFVFISRRNSGKPSWRFILPSPSQ